MRRIAVTAADPQFYTLVIGAIASLRANMPPGGLDIGVLDIGLHDWQLAALAHQVEHIIKPAQVIDFPRRAATHNGLQAVINKAFLRDLFPSYELFMWMDADAWVQDQRAIATYLEAASSRQMVITPEVHRHYSSIYQDSKTIRQTEYEIYSCGWGEAAASRMVQCPLANAGVFALHRDADAWSTWGDTVKKLLEHTTNFYVEQTALNGAILTQRIPIVSLPAHYNWICHYATPVIDVSSRELFEPGYPAQKLFIVHMTHDTKFRLVDVNCTDGRRIQVSLRYPLQID